MKPKKVDILRIDTDTRFLYQSVNQLIQRLSYLEDVGAFPIRYIDKIIASKKRKWHIKIHLNKKIDVNLSIMIELILGDDWRRSINVLINYHALNMTYYSRLFDIKVYPNGKILYSRKKDITDRVLSKVKSTKRKKYNN